MDLGGWPGWLVVFLLVFVVATIAAVAYLLVKLLRTYKLLRREDMPVSGKVAFWGAVLYLVSPVDFLPDPILLDDIGALFAALTYVSKLGSGETVDGSATGRSQPSSRRTDGAGPGDHSDQEPW